MGRIQGYGLGGIVAPLTAHLRALEDELLDSLRNRYYSGLNHDTKVAMRRQGLVPRGIDNQPQVYSIWLRCRQWNRLWWQGGIADQPYVLMAEFTVCEAVHARFQQWQSSIQAILRGGSA